MTIPDIVNASPKVFISYSWDDDAHKLWVLQLAFRLRADGVDVTLDRWHSAPGSQISQFLQRSVRENDFVIAICTPRFKEKSDGGGGGIGYESDIMTAHAFKGEDKRKFIPVLRRGNWEDSSPTWFLGRAYIDLSGDPYSLSEYERLLRTLHGVREKAPSSGYQPDFGKEEGFAANSAPKLGNPIETGSTPQHHSSVTPAAERNGVGSRDPARRRRPDPLADPSRPDEREFAEEPGLPSPTILELAVELLKNPYEWLDHPNPQFGGRTPNELIDAGEEEKVYNLLRCAQLGMF